MESLFDKLCNAVEKLNDHIDGSLDEIRKCKGEIRDMRDDMYNQFASGYYIRDDNRIIISAPNIIIGNVDKSGCAFDDSEIVLRGKTIKMEGVGADGRIEATANNIDVVAEDHGPDGNESAVHPTSTVSIIGRSIGIDSNNSEGTFSHRMLASTGGLSLHSDTMISLESSLQSDAIASEISRKIASLSKEIAALTQEAIAQRVQVKAKLAVVKSLLALDDPLHTDESTTWVSALIIDNLSENLSKEGHSFLVLLTKYLETVTSLAEKKRQKTVLEKQKSELPVDLSKQPNGCDILIKAENVDIDCSDGNNKVRTDADSGVTINSPHTTITSKGDDHRNIPESTFTLHTQNIVFNTANIKDADKDKAEDEAMFEADGKLHILSKEVSMQAIDYKKKDKEQYHCEKLCEQGSLTVEVTKLHADTTDEKGKAVGEIKLNSKTISLQGADVDADSRKEKELSKESKVVVLANTFKVGGTSDDKVKAAKIQMLAKTSTLQGEDTLYIYQGKDKTVDAGVKLSGKKADIIGSEITLYGDSSTHKMSIDALTSKKITTDAADVKSTLSAPNSKWGNGVAQEGSAKKPNAKPENEDTKFITSDK